LTALKLKVEPLSLRTDCGESANPIVDCHPDKPCLFDIDRDPCERTNLAGSHPDQVKKLLQIYEQYNRQYSKPANQPRDPEADPQKHGGWWVPWKDHAN